MAQNDYASEIKESVGTLLVLEQQLAGKRTAIRVRMLRLLKSGEVKSLYAAAPVLGYRYRQLQYWWAWYREGGIDALLVLKPRPGKPSRMTQAAYAGLEAEMLAGNITTLKDAQDYLHNEWGITYRSLNGIWVQLRKHRKPTTRANRAPYLKDVPVLESWIRGRTTIERMPAERVPAAAAAMAMSAHSVSK
jgi:transposase